MRFRCLSHMSIGLCSFALSVGSLWPNAKLVRSDVLHGPQPYGRMVLGRVATWVAATGVASDESTCTVSDGAPPKEQVRRLVKNRHCPDGRNSSASFAWPAHPTPLHPWQSLLGRVATWVAVTGERCSCSCQPSMRRDAYVRDGAWWWV